LSSSDYLKHSARLPQCITPQTAAYCGIFETRPDALGGLIASLQGHRAARRHIPSWIAAAINEQAPDILVLTEYVEGPDYDFGSIERGAVSASVTVLGQLAQALRVSPCDLIAQPQGFPLFSFFISRNENV
jgi:hypothetical protein